MYRIYFDSNEGDVSGYGLDLRPSLTDLSGIPGGPKDGLLVTIYMGDELEAEALLEWSAVGNLWIARPPLTGWNWRYPSETSDQV